MQFQPNPRGLKKVTPKFTDEAREKVYEVLLLLKAWGKLWFRQSAKYFQGKSCKRPTTIQFCLFRTKNGRNKFL